MTRVHFLAFALGMFLGAWMGTHLRPQELKPLDVKVECAPASTGI